MSCQDLYTVSKMQLRYSWSVAKKFSQKCNAALLRLHFWQPISHQWKVRLPLNFHRLFLRGISTHWYTNLTHLNFAPARIFTTSCHTRQVAWEWEAPVSKLIRLTSWSWWRTSANCPRVRPESRDVTGVFRCADLRSMSCITWPFTKQKLWQICGTLLICCKLSVCQTFLRWGLQIRGKLQQIKSHTFMTSETVRKFCPTFLSHGFRQLTCLSATLPCDVTGRWQFVTDEKKLLQSRHAHPGGGGTPIEKVCG